MSVNEEKYGNIEHAAEGTAEESLQNITEEQFAEKKVNLFFDIFL